jgi:hypothetical protein
MLIYIFRVARTQGHNDTEVPPMEMEGVEIAGFDVSAEKEGELLDEPEVALSAAENWPDQVVASSLLLVRGTRGFR